MEEVTFAVFKKKGRTKHTPLVVSTLGPIFSTPPNGEKVSLRNYITFTTFIARVGRVLLVLHCRFTIRWPFVEVAIAKLATAAFAAAAARPTELA